MRQDIPSGPAGVVGTGRVARALACALGQSGPTMLWGRSPERTAEAAAQTGASGAASLADLVARCGMVAIAVADDAIALLVERMAALPLAHRPFVFHVSGRSGAAILKPLEQAGASIAAVHPAMTFTGDPAREVERMAGARFAVTGSGAQAAVQARALVAMLGGIAVEVAEEHRALYHAALCHGANHLVTLLSGAIEALAAAGVAEPAALLAPLVRAALENTLDNGFAALSGPVLRGDGGTVAGHLEAIAAHDPMLLPAYRAMAAETLAQLERRGREDTALRAILGAGQPR